MAYSDMSNVHLDDIINAEGAEFKGKDIDLLHYEVYQDSIVNTTVLDAGAYYNQRVIHYLEIGGGGYGRTQSTFYFNTGLGTYITKYRNSTESGGSVVHRSPKYLVPEVDWSIPEFLDGKIYAGVLETVKIFDADSQPKSIGCFYPNKIVSDWNNDMNLKEPDNSSALKQVEVLEDTGSIEASHFNISIPEGKKIVGIKVYVKRRQL